MTFAILELLRLNLLTFAIFELLRKFCECCCDTYFSFRPSDVPDRPKTSRGQAGQRSISGTSSRGSSAVNRFSQLEKDIMSRQSKPIPVRFVYS